MGRRSISGPKGRSEGGTLSIKERDGYWHLSGTLRLGSKKQRIRQSTGIPVQEDPAKERAHAVRRRIETEFENFILYGKQPSKSFGAVAHSYLDASDPGITDLKNLEELLKKFESKAISDITAEDIDGFYRARFPNAKPSTIARHQRTLNAVFMHAVDKEWIPSVPRYTRATAPTRKGKNLAKYFLKGEFELIIDQCRTVREKAILATIYSTGHRVQEVLSRRREDFILAEGKGRVFWDRTKNGRAYTSALHDYTVDFLLEWIATRTDDHPEMFLTPKRRPYVLYQGSGGQIKSMWDRARDKAVAKLIKEGSHDRARVVAQSTPHWGRHNFANQMRLHGADLRMTQEGGHWESLGAVESYAGDLPEQTENLIRSIPVGEKRDTKLTRDTEKK